MKPPPRGRIMTKTGIDTVAVQAPIIPALGVEPPSKSASHSSNRRAPPRSAASDDATESTQASTRIGASPAVTTETVHASFPPRGSQPNALARLQVESRRQPRASLMRLYAGDTS